MKNKLLGRSGLRVSELCLGAMTFGEESNFGAPETTARQIFDRYCELGGNFIDIANIYNAGTSERMVGDFVRGQRDAFVIASKFSMSTDLENPNASGNNRKNMVQALEASLQRIGTDYLDVYWVHGWDQLTRVDELMRALDDMVRSGKVLHVAVSNMPAWVISQANTLAEERGQSAFSAVQMHYNLVERSIETDFFALCEQQDMAVLAWSPLAGGLLTGKFNRDADQSSTSDSRLKKTEYGPAMLVEHRLAIAEGLTAVAKRLDCTPSQLALAWLLHRPQGRVIPILGARTVEQFEDNLGCLDISLEAADIAELDALAPPAVTYPASLFATDFYRRMIHGANPAEGYG